MKVRGVKMMKRGFTMLELLIVITVMAIVATLATGAAVSSIKQGRRKRIQVTVQALNTAVECYHSRQGAWPFSVRQLRHLPDVDAATEKVKISDKAILAPMYASLYQGGYLDGSGLLCVTDSGARKPLNKISRSSPEAFQICYVRVEDSSEIGFFKMTYNFITDSVSFSE